MLVKVVARDTARLRVKVSVGFAGKRAGRISRDPRVAMHPREWILRNCWRLKEAHAYALSPFSTLSTSLFMKRKLAFRTAYVSTREDPLLYSGDNSHGECSPKLWARAGDENCCVGIISPDLTYDICSNMARLFVNWRLSRVLILKSLEFLIYLYDKYLSAKEYELYIYIFFFSFSLFNHIISHIYLAMKSLKL